MATEAARFKSKNLYWEKRKTKTTLTLTGLLMEGVTEAVFHTHHFSTGLYPLDSYGKLELRL